MPRRTSPSNAVATLKAIGGSIGGCEIDNERLSAGFAIGKSFLLDRLGFVKRAIKHADQDTSDLCVAAFEDLKTAMSVDSSAVELICVVTQNPDTRVPHTAAILHEKLSLGSRCMTFDLSQGCAGFSHGLATVVACVERLGLRGALLFTCDPYSKIVDPNDRDTALIFSDAATASWIAPGVGGYRLVDADFGISPGTAACLRLHDGQLRMEGRAIVSNAAREVPASVRRVLARNNLLMDSIDLFLLHPGSKYMLDLLRRELELEVEVAPFPACDYGNTVSSSIPLMLRQYWDRKDARRIIVSGFGVGFSWGTCLIERTYGRAK